MGHQQESFSQAQYPDYFLHTLGWKAFQDLCATIASSVFGQTLQTFSDSRDGGRDGAFFGTWKPGANEALSGTFTMQCKFTAKANRSLKLNLLEDELVKAQRLAKNGLADNYILFTNFHLSGIKAEEIEEAFHQNGIKGRCLLYGHERISSTIRESAELRMLVPRIYGLGDLSQIMDERAYSQAQKILSALGGDLSKFVITKSHTQSARAISEHNFVLLLGEPASGKSTIAAALALGALDRWGYPPIKARNPEDFVKHWNADDPRQFFWIDDAFGATQLDYNLISEWNRTFPHLHGAIRKGTRVLLTSRDYIYRAASERLKLSAFPIINESQVVINVQELSVSEREQILYNHIRLGTQPIPFKKEIKKFLPACANHEGFSPELARRLGNPLFTKLLKPSKSSLIDFFSHPQELLQEIIKSLDDESRATLSLVFMNGGALPSPIEYTNEKKEALTLLGGSVSGVRKATAALKDTLLLQVSEDSGTVWKFKHPTIQDAFANLAASDRELLDIYLIGAPIEHLFNEIVCGAVQIRGASIQIPPDRFSLVLNRISKLYAEADWKEINQIYRFLGNRCGKDFLSMVVQDQPEIINNIKLWSYLSAIPEMDVLVLLNAAGLLQPERKAEYIEAIRELAVETPDSGFLSQQYKSFFSRGEKEAILHYVAENLPSDLDSTIRNWKFNYSTDDDPEEYFQDLVDCLRDYADSLSSEIKFVEAIEQGLDQIQIIVEELKHGRAEEEEASVLFSEPEKVASEDLNRSIFDDVDQ